jgi:MSHA biogenesis protein MshO
MATQRNQRGITLIELITVISILGVIASVASVFIRGPIDAYVDGTRRAALTDSADTAMRRIARDIRKALPNSTRIVPNPLSPTTNCLEFIPTKMSGRYRASLPGNILDFVTATGDDSFNMLGLNSDLPTDQQIEGDDWIAVYNLGARPVAGGDANTDADAYTGANISKVLGVELDATTPQETTITISPKKFPLTSGSKRFYVIPAAESIVSYVCEGGKLLRTARDFAHADDTCSTTDSSILASNVNVASCEFSHDVSNLQRNEPVRLTITFTDSGESVSLYHQVYENNWP